MKAIIEINGFERVIKEPTRITENTELLITENTETLIDLIAQQTIYHQFRKLMVHRILLLITGKVCTQLMIQILQPILHKTIESSFR